MSSSNAWTKIQTEPVPRVSLRPAEAAESLGISERTLRDWMREPGFPAARIGGCWLIPVDGLRGWLADRLASREDAA